MGYDMHMVKKPKATPEGHSPQYEGQPGYHRFRASAMPLTIGAMEWADCVHYGSAPGWPEIPEGISGERLGAVVYFLESGDDSVLEDGPMTPAEEAIAREYARASSEVRDASSLKDGRVGAYKFESNDGWLVHPEECEAIATAVRRHAEMIARDFFTDAGLSVSDGLAWLKSWADFNALAASHGGYRVH